MSLIKKGIFSTLLITLLTFGSTLPLVGAQTTPITPTPPANENSEQPAGDPPSGENVQGNEVEVQIEAQTPASVTGETMQGNGTVVDYTTSGSKAFYTIVDSEQKTFYLIIDMDKTQNNVYFLKDINQSELEGSATPSEAMEGVAQTTLPAEELTSAIPNETPEESSNSGLGFALMVLLIAVGGVAAYYFLVMRKRHKRNKIQPNENTNDEMLEDYDDDFDDDDFDDDDSNRKAK